MAGGDGGGGGDRKVRPWPPRARAPRRRARETPARRYRPRARRVLAPCGRGESRAHWDGPAAATGPRPLGDKSRSRQAVWRRAEGRAARRLETGGVERHPEEDQEVGGGAGRKRRGGAVANSWGGAGGGAGRRWEELGEEYLGLTCGKELGEEELLEEEAELGRSGAELGKSRAAPTPPWCPGRAFEWPRLSVLVAQHPGCLCCPCTLRARTLRVSTLWHVRFPLLDPWFLLCWQAPVLLPGTTVTSPSAPAASVWGSGSALCLPAASLRWALLPGLELLSRSPGKTRTGSYSFLSPREQECRPLGEERRVPSRIRGLGAAGDLSDQQLQVPPCRCPLLGSSPQAWLPAASRHPGASSSCFQIMREGPVGVGWCLAAPVRGAPLQLSLDLQYKNNVLAGTGLLSFPSAHLG
ncbi:uncharacterized protein [Eschrichtius robustus]|uniref:uncharacterized protein n=1 Tax=Eschrichtius robustus TaxID=9764 RepID=UPI0035C181FB